MLEYVIWEPIQDGRRKNGKWYFQNFWKKFMSTRSVLYENLSERYYLVQKHILSQNQVK